MERETTSTTVHSDETQSKPGPMMKVSHFVSPRKSVSADDDVSDTMAQATSEFFETVQQQIHDQYRGNPSSFEFSRSKGIF